jgi:hypothetical protein
MSAAKIRRRLQMSNSQAAYDAGRAAGASGNPGNPKGPDVVVKAFWAGVGDARKG